MRCVWCLLFGGLMATEVTAVHAAEGKPEIWIESLTGTSFVKIKKACSQIGARVDPFELGGQTLLEVGYQGGYSADERPLHKVCLSEFWIGRHEVTAEAWERVMETPPPQGRGTEPASGVSWREAVRFAERLTAGNDGRSVFRLPTEAEWEIACLAGKPELVTGENDAFSLMSSTVFWGNNQERPVRPHPQKVGSRQPNAWGLFDMRGNVVEWVLDDYAKDGYKSHQLYDPIVNNASRQRVLRGGSYRSELVKLRCASRGWYFEEESLPSIGFRLVRKVKP